MATFDVCLVVTKGKTRTREVHLSRDETIVGRQHDSDLRVLSREVSRRHCLLRKQNGYLVVEDLDSANGTLLNGQKVECAVVRPGDRLQIGPVTFTVEYEWNQELIEQLRDAETSTELEGAEQAAKADPDELDDLPASADVELVPLDDVVPLEPDDAEEPTRPSPADMDDSYSLRMPDSEAMRDILAGMDDGAADPPPRKKKKSS